jgi:hydrogenase maturation protein HypF
VIGHARPRSRGPSPALVELPPPSQDAEARAAGVERGPLDAPPPRAIEISIRGVVQGVGFRPFVHRLAIRHRISGWVRNEAGAVRVVAQGASPDLDDFLAALQSELPPLARIDALVVLETRPESLEGFRVVASDLAPVGRLPVSPDVAICASCQRELFDPANRRHRYPFITCTDCGPRFTVIESMPYDRERSTMRAFEQCPECLREYRDPADRRYHSETNSCPACGPKVWLESTGTTCLARGGDAIVEAARLVVEGRILALRGLGGFHLAVDATNEHAVRLLRERKSREAKPLAVMVSNLREAERLALVSDGEAAVLTSRERPIVVLKRRARAPLAQSLAPGLDSVGLVLAYTPLHLLLLEAAGRPLVMTSGNVSDEPIAIGNDEARLGLARVADVFLLHDRDIVARYDDSLVRVAAGRTVFLRRSRGYAPMPVALPVPTTDAIFAVGPHLKNTFTLAQGNDAFVSQHVGDLENLETLEHFRDALGRFKGLFRIEPRWVVRDLHPGYLSTRIAEESGLLELPAVQHHHAHIAAVMGEHGVTDRTLGIALDGTGYGVDGHVWGCELIEADLRDYRRLAHLRYAPLPGGDLAVRAPWRALLGYASLEEGTDGWLAQPLAGVREGELAAARYQLRRRINSPLASSMGRLFDAAAAALGIRFESAYEGHAAMELESVSRCDGEPEPLPFPVATDAEGLPVLDPVPLLAALALAREHGADVGQLAARFHETVAGAVCRLAVELCERRELGRVALGGGCFQNARLLASMRRRLEHAGLEVLAPLALGPNDGAVSYGQAVVAAARLGE